MAALGYIVHDVKQGSDAWHHLRAGLPTGSEASSLVTSDNLPSKSWKEYARALAGEKYADAMVDGWWGNKYTDRGHEFEPEACAAYAMLKNTPVDHVGFITNTLMQYGVSPDGLVEKDGAVEIKCKIAKVHIAILIHYLTYGTAPSEYYAQPQMVMFTCKRKWCDLWFYHPKLPSIRIRQYPNKDFVKVLKKQLKAVATERDHIVEQLKTLEN